MSSLDSVGRLLPLRRFGAASSRPRNPATPRSLRPGPPEPDLDLDLLTEQIERIVARRKAPGQAATTEAKAARAAWLGEDEDLALVKRGPRASGVVAGAEPEAAPGAAPGAAQVATGTGQQDDAGDIGTTYDRADTLEWVRKAHRQRFTSRLRSATGWLVSAAAVVAVAAALALSIPGSPFKLPLTIGASETAKPSVAEADLIPPYNFPR